MASNKTAVRIAGESGNIVAAPHASAGTGAHGSPARQGWTTAKRVALGAALACIPFLCWLVGSGIVWATPANYRSSVLLQVEGGYDPQDLKSQDVMSRAAATLGQLQGRNHAANPMSSYLLWSSVTITPGPGANLIQLEARGNRADDARRTVLAVAEAYRERCREAGADTETGTTSAQLPALIYIAPPEVAPARVPDDTRMMLGIAGMAALCLLLCIPILVIAERHMPALAGLGLRRGPLALPA